MQQKIILIKKKKSFQNDVRITLNHEEIPKDRQSITEIAAYISKYNRKGINNPPEIDDQKKIEKKNLTIALNAFYAKQQKIYPSYVSKYN